MAVIKDNSITADDDDKKWTDAIVSILEKQQGSNDHTTTTTTFAAAKNDDNDDDGEQDHATSSRQQQQLMKVKKLRKQVLLSLQYDDESDNKAAKKIFKKTVQRLEDEGRVQLDADGTIRLLSCKKKRKKEEKEKKKKKESKKEMKKKKRKRKEEEESDENHHDMSAATGDGHEDGPSSPVQKPKPEQQHDETTSDDNNRNETPTKDKNVPCKGNPQGITRLFVGNLPFAVDETSLESFLPGLTHIKWITDKETGKFYGSAFCEMDTSESAANAVTKKAGKALMGRPIKINFAPARPGDMWPPEKKVIRGGDTTPATTTTTGASAGGSGIKALPPKPPDCKKLFIGNLSYEIDDETTTKFFANVDAEVKAIRWIHHKDSGDFKGVGFVEFWNTEACEKAATLNGKNLLGRPIRIDWTD